MGPNGSGKSTLSSVIAGREEYEIEDGSVDFNGSDIMELSPEERSHKGIFLSLRALINFFDSPLNPCTYVIKTASFFLFIFFTI